MPPHYKQNRARRFAQTPSLAAIKARLAAPPTTSGSMDPATTTGRSRTTSTDPTSALIPAAADCYWAVLEVRGRPFRRSILKRQRRSCCGGERGRSNHRAVDAVSLCRRHRVTQLTHQRELTCGSDGASWKSCAHSCVAHPNAGSPRALGIRPDPSGHTSTDLPKGCRQHPCRNDAVGFSTTRFIAPRSRQRLTIAPTRHRHHPAASRGSPGR